MLRILGFLVFGLSSLAAHSYDCRIASMSQDCKVFLREDRARIPLGNDTFLINPASTEKPSSPAELLSPQKLEERKARVREMFQWAQRKMIEQVRKGRTDSQLTAAELNVISRIENVQLAPLNGESAAIGGSNSGMEVELSGGLLTAPESVVAGIIAHEIGHSVDSCGLRTNVYERNRRMTEDELLGKLVNKVESRKSPGLTYYEGVIPGTENMAVKLFRSLTSAEGIPVLNRQIHSNSNARRLMESQVRNGNFKLSAEALPPELNPVRAVLQCLVKRPEMANIQNPLLGSGARPSEHALARSNPSLAQDCLSQAPEITSDVWGAKIQGEWLKENPPRTDWERLAIVSPALIEQCGARRPSESGTSDHGSFKRRFENIYMDEPEVEKALGCQRVQGERCSDQFGRSAMSSGAPAVSPAPRSASGRD